MSNPEAPFSYYQINGSETILRLHNNRIRHDLTLIIDMLHGGGWWRTQPVDRLFFASRTTPLENFEDNYPQEFLGRDK